MRRRPKFNISTTIHDYSFLMVVFFGLLCAILITLINPTKADKDSPTSGDMMVEAHWVDGLDVDVDLWVRGPQDASAVGYSNRAGKQCSYLRDDVGMRNDLAPRNFEIVACRGLVSGRYIVNIHLYNARETSPPIDVEVVVSLTPQAGPRVEIARHSIQLQEDGHEATAVTFILDEAGAVVPGSVQTGFIPLRGRQ